MIRNITPVPAVCTGGRCLPVTYTGSITDAHGTAWLVDDCDCTSCAQLDLWDPARRYVLRVDVEYLDGRVPVRKAWRLTHVSGASFTRACPVHP